VEIDKIGEELLGALQGANTIINSKDVRSSVRDLEASLKSLRSILKKVDNSNLQEAIDAGHGALEKLNVTLTLTNQVLRPDSPLHYNAIQLTGELEETARAIRALVETLQRKPEAVIFGKDGEGE
jgi:paraquat-inducible protein B